MNMFKNDKCPICEKEIIHKEYIENGIVSEYLTVCKNNCCAEEFAYGGYRVYFFDKHDKELIWSYNSSKEERKIVNDKIKEQIEYWRYNDRYLMELLTR